MEPVSVEPRSHTFDETVLEAVSDDVAAQHVAEGEAGQSRSTEALVTIQRASRSSREYCTAFTRLGGIDQVVPLSGPQCSQRSINGGYLHQVVCYSVGSLQYRHHKAQGLCVNFAHHVARHCQVRSHVVPCAPGDISYAHCHSAGLHDSPSQRHRV